MATKLTTSVIIPAYSVDRLADILKAIKSVEAQTRPANEIIVAVDHNEDLVAMVNASRTSVRTVLNNSYIGGAETRNAGIRTAKGDICVFLDDDAWAEPNWLEELIAIYNDPNVMAVGGKTISYFPNGRPKWFPAELDWAVGGIWEGHPENKCEVRNLIGPNMSFRRAVCDVVGMMRPELGAMPKKARAGDETEFYIRLKNLIPSAKVMYVPTAVVHHMVYDWKLTISNLVKRSFSDGYWKNHLMAKSSSYKKDRLSSERHYLRYLLTSSIPKRLVRFWNYSSLTQLSAIIGSGLCFGTGYIWGGIQRKLTRAH